MQYYQDITLLPDNEITLGFIWQKVYQQIHLALVEHKVAENSSAIGLAFPDYKSKTYPLGNKLRLFAATPEQLDTLAIDKWLKRFSDHTHITSVKAVPDGISEFVCVKRKQCKTNLSRLARRRVKRKGESFEQALQHYASFNDEQTKLPFINVVSLSKKEQFRLFIEQLSTTKLIQGDFTCYGLSKGQTTVPWF